MAQDAMEALDTRFSVRTDAWSGTRHLDGEQGVGTASVWAKGKYTFDAIDARLVFDGWVRAETRDDDATEHARLRELYWSQSWGPVSVKVGRLITAWGKADGINPTDNLSPRDFTLLVPEEGDARKGRDAFQVRATSDQHSLTAWWSPQFTANNVPLPSRPMTQYVAMPSRSVSDWALKWEHSAQGADVSVSYYDGHDLWPDFFVAGLGLSGAQVGLRYNRRQVLGADFSLNQGSVVWRGETAWTHTDSTGRLDFTHKKPQWLSVVGPEWNVDGVTLGVQAVYQRVFHFARPDEAFAGASQWPLLLQMQVPVMLGVATLGTIVNNQTRADQWGLTTRVSKRWLGDNLLTELNVVVLGPEGQGAVRTKVDYAVNDRWSVQVGSESFFGQSETFFGQLRKNSLAYAQARYGF